MADRGIVFYTGIAQPVERVEAPFNSDIMCWYILRGCRFDSSPYGAILRKTMITELGRMRFPHYHLVPKDMLMNVRFRRYLLEKAQTSPGFRIQLYKMCEEDMLFYINAFCFTFDPRPDVQLTPKTPFITYEAFQDEAMAEIGNAVLSGGDIAIPKSRCMGASWMGLTVFEWLWHFRSDMSFLLVSRNEKYVDDGTPKSLFGKIDFLHKNQPKWLLPPGRNLGDKDPNRKKLHLGNSDNDSTIDGESTTGDAGRGDRRSGMFIDEHAAFEVSDGFNILSATRDTTKTRIFNSTPQGANNAFYEVVHNTACLIIRLHWSKHPKYNRGMYTSENGTLRKLDEWIGDVEQSVKGEKLKQKYSFPGGYPFILDGKLRSPWYDSECARCVTDMEVAQELDIDFLGSDYQYFDPVTITKLMERYCRKEFLRGFLEYDPIDLEPTRFTEHEKGNLRLWMQLTPDGGVRRDTRFVLGTDVSAGTGASNSATSIVDRTTGNKVGVLIDPNIAPKEFADLTIALAKFFGGAHLIWDASGAVGKTFTMQVIARGYGNIYYRKDEDKISQKQTDKPGYFLNPEARTTLLNNYRSALDSHSFMNPSLQGMKETMQFVVKPGGIVEHSRAANSQDPSGARSAHGDEVIADALANKGLEERAQSNEPEERPVPVGCLAWRMQQKELEAHVSVKELDDGW